MNNEFWVCDVNVCTYKLPNTNKFVIFFHMIMISHEDTFYIKIVELD